MKPKSACCAGLAGNALGRAHTGTSALALDVSCTEETTAYQQVLALDFSLVQRGLLPAELEALQLES